MKQHQQNSITLFRFNNFPSNGQVQHAVFSRRGGLSQAPYDTLNLSRSVPDAEANVFANRARAYATHGRSNSSLVHAHLKHGVEVAVVSHKNYGQYVGPADGLITNEPGCGLTMNYADCAGIFLYDPVNKATGLGHAGWQGVVKDLPGAVVRAMQVSFGSDPARLVAAIGPCIGPCCYEVGEPVISAVKKTMEEPESLLILQPNGNRPHFDLPEANRQRLVAAGVEQVELSELCTACRTDLFYSHRAEKGRTGRFGALLLLAEE
jgi:YfiH family protein